MKIKDIEAQIIDNQTKTSYQPINWPVKYIIDEFLRGNLIVPKFQREFRWDKPKQSKFVESHIIGLPIPSVFIATNKEGKKEIIDGSQRIRTLVAFVCSQSTLDGIEGLSEPLKKLKLEKLEKLTTLNNTYFDDLPISEKEVFLSKGIWVNMLERNVSNESKVRMFERINTKSVDLTSMEKRIGIYDGIFITDLIEISKNLKLREMLSLSNDKNRQKTHEELVLRFFGYFDLFSNQLPPKVKYRLSPEPFLNDYTDFYQNKAVPSRLKKIFNETLTFVEKYIEHGFVKKVPGQSATYSNVRFEALSVGIALAIHDGGKIDTANIKNRIYSPEFISIVSSDSANNTSKLTDRILYVKNKLLTKSYVLLGKYR